MKETIVQVLQAQMDKCTNEQFWAVASLTAADGIFITQQQELAKIPDALSLIFLGGGMLYGVCFIVQRHAAYYRLHNFRAKLLQNEDDAPDFMKEKAKPWRFQEYSGVVFYVGWLVVGYVLCFFAA